MPTLDALPPDQRAVLQMVLQGGRTYDEIASLLAIDRAAVRQRALDALDALGPETSVATLERGLLTDYLLGQLPPRVATQVRDRLAESPTQRAWARVVAGELAPLSPGGLPEIPAAARRAPEPARPAPAPEPARPAPEEEPRWEEVARTGVAAPAAAATAPSAREPRASRRGGAVLLAIVGLIVIAVIAVVIILVTSSSSSTSGTPARTSTAAPATTGTVTSTTGTSTSTAKTQVLNDTKLTAPSGAKSPVGVLVIAKSGTTLGMIIEATGLAANSTNKKAPNAYAVWLTNTSTHANHFLGFDENAVSSNGRFAISYPLTGDVSAYNEILITLETAEHPKSPGTVVLSGPFSLVHK